MTEASTEEAGSALPAPGELSRSAPLTPALERTIQTTRSDVAAVVCGRDLRFLVVVGPCSIHDEEAALEYAARLGRLQRRYAEDLVVCMRVYLEKPRTTTGWKGFLHDPDLDGSGNVARGLLRARRLMLSVIEQGLGVASELLDPILAAYQSELLSWAAIGARTSESQVHRELASRQPFAMGFKNGTDGRVDGALNALLSAAQPHTTLSIDANGRACLSQSAGNLACHVVLRGGEHGPNYARQHVEHCARQLEANGSLERVMIDCSHGNSQKDPRRQADVWNDVIDQLSSGAPILGAMLESHLVSGKQSFADKACLRYGQSITDACIDLEQTEVLLERAARAKAAQRRPSVHSPAQSSPTMRAKFVRESA